MDRRSEERHPAETVIDIVVLGDIPRKLRAVLQNISGRGARLRVEEPIAVDSALRLDLDNSMLLGEVCYCASDAGAFSVGVELLHSLTNLARVARLRDRVLAESTPR